MPLNWQTFRTRSLTAAVFVVVMLAGLLWNQWSFFLLFSVIHFGCWWEFLKLTEKIYRTSFHLYIKFGFMLLGYGFLCWFCGPEYQVNQYAIKANLSMPFSAAGFILVVLGIFRNSVIHLAAFGMAIVGILYISIPWGMMIDLYGRELINPLLYQGASAWLVFFPLFTIACMWVNDTMAYVVGSLIGRTPLSPISPKKTWEGTLGGILLGAGIVGYMAARLDKDYLAFGQSLSFWLGLSLTAVIVGTFGDLLESKLKRMAGVKDSGRIMPGHGGFMDRFDSLLLATPFVWLYVQFFMS